MSVTPPADGAPAPRLTRSSQTPLDAGNAPGRRRLPEPRPGADGTVGFDPRDIAAYYAFPDTLDGTGTTIAVISLAGAVRPTDLASYFSVMPGIAPAVDFVVRTGSATELRVDPELTLCVELIGAAAPGARQLLFLVEDSESGILNGLSEAIHSEQRIDVLCLPWAFDADVLSPASNAAVTELLETAAALGVPVCAPAGIWTGDRLQPTFPGANPLVLACGPTRAERDGADLIEQPTAGVAGSSAAAPGAGAPPRRVPDVCALSAGEIGYRVCLNGEWTSGIAPAAAPALWAALLARLREGLGRPFDVTGILPGQSAWDPRLGWGTPDGQRLLAALAQ